MQIGHGDRLFYLYIALTISEPLCWLLDLHHIFCNILKSCIALKSCSSKYFFFPKNSDSPWSFPLLSQMYTHLEFWVGNKPGTAFLCYPKSCRTRKLELYCAGNCQIPIFQLDTRCSLNCSWWDGNCIRLFRDLRAFTSHRSYFPCCNSWAGHTLFCYPIWQSGDKKYFIFYDCEYWVVIYIYVNYACCSTILFVMF